MILSIDKYDSDEEIIKKINKMNIYANNNNNIYIYIQSDLPIVIKLWMSNSLLKTKQEIISKCCANDSFQTIKHCNWPIETHYFRAPISLLREFFTKIHFRSVEK